MYTPLPLVPRTPPPTPTEAYKRAREEDNEEPPCKKTKVSDQMPGKLKLERQVAHPHIYTDSDLNSDTVLFECHYDCGGPLINPDCLGTDEVNLAEIGLGYAHNHCHRQAVNGYVDESNSCDSSWNEEHRCYTCCAEIPESDLRSCKGQYKHCYEKERICDTCKGFSSDPYDMFGDEYEVQLCWECYLKYRDEHKDEDEVVYTRTENVGNQPVDV
jgi:hypothetical protein